MELFLKVVYCWELLTNFAKSSIVNVWLAQEYVSVLVPFITRKAPTRCLIVNFESFLGSRKRALKLLVTFLFHSGTSTMTCYNTYLLLWQYWSMILSVSLGLLFHPGSHRQFCFYKNCWNMWWMYHLCL